MQTLLKFARIFFALDLAGLALQLALTGHFSAGLPPFPPTLAASHTQIYGIAGVMLLLAVGMLVPRAVATCSLLLGLIYTGSAFMLHGAYGQALLQNGNLRTVFLETLAIGAGALALFAIEAKPPRAFQEAQTAIGFLALVLFALCIAVFGYQHFEFLRFVAPLVPRWIPAHALWVQITGAAMIAAAIAFFLPRVAVPAGIALGVMFLLWFFLLHVPRVIASPHNRDEWTSAIIVLAMADASWIMAAGRARKGIR